MRHITIQYLKTKRKDTLNVIDSIKNLRLRETSTDTIQDYTYLIAELCVYEDLIKYMKGLNGREFQVQRKKGTL